MLLIMFELKKILGGLLMPLPLLGLVSLILLIFALKQRKVAIVRIPVMVNTDSGFIVNT